MAKHTLKILRCEHRIIFKVCLAILQHYAWKGQKKKNLGFYETLVAELRLEDECNYKILFKNYFWKLWINILGDKRRHN